MDVAPRKIMPSNACGFQGLILNKVNYLNDKNSIGLKPHILFCIIKKQAALCYSAFCHRNVNSYRLCFPLSTLSIVNLLCFPLYRLPVALLLNNSISTSKRTGAYTKQDRKKVHVNAHTGSSFICLIITHLFVYGEDIVRI